MLHPVFAKNDNNDSETPSVLSKVRYNILRFMDF